jgi:hypothetical protein
LNPRLPPVCLAALLPCSALAAPNFKDGLWVITSKSEMPGMPMQMPTHTHRQCLTSKEPIPEQPQQGKCKK